MKKKILVAVMLSILVLFTACKKDPAQAGPKEESGGEAFQLEESLEIELEEGTDGVLAPD